MPVPSSTYRIQFNQHFGFRDLQRILDYLDTLGVNTVYASPIMQATPGSMHGYDVTDPHTVNAELGSADELRGVIRDLRKKDMLWLQDIVPNHMAFHTGNFRLMDVLERGGHSPFYRYFDIDWNHRHPDLNGKVMVPFLGDTPEKCIAEGQISLVFSEEGFTVNYFDTAYPLSLSAYAVICKYIESGDSGKRLSGVLEKMAIAGEGRDYETWRALKREYVNAINEYSEQPVNVQNLLSSVNADISRLKEVLDNQYYRLSFWKESDDRINYRRFFTVNELICLRMEDDKVFDEYHLQILRLYRERLVDGFRIDHIDGLHDPAKYTRDLRAQLSPHTYIIAEKILESKEDMPTHWSLQGTSGYEFLSFLNQLLTHRKGARQLLSYYKELVPELPAYQKLIFSSKKLILENHMKGEWDNITNLFESLGLLEKFDRTRMKKALGYFMLSLPVYRIYPDDIPLKGKSLLTIHEAFDKSLKPGAAYAAEIHHLRELFTGTPESEDRQSKILLFLKRLMQFTGPLTAKGVEDTTFYIYNPLISHDEVGDSPSSFSMTVRRFHDKMSARQTSTPLSLNATGTHDTKRGEDARVRINVLSRIPTLWQHHVEEWLKLNDVFRSQSGGKIAPQLNDEYFIYQSMLGGFPEDFKVTDEWIQRVKAYLIKALREAKVNTSWSDPDEAYEKACEKFVEDILNPGHGFLASFTPFVKTVAEHAMIYTLSQTLIKLTAPGIPDIYQGCELWDLSFVDPDNRRPVDYEKRMQFLFQLVVREEKGKEAVFEYLREHREEGIEKLYVIWKTLQLRKKQPDLFTEGDYLPVAISGEEVSAAAYARVKNATWVLILFPLGLVTHDTDNIDSFKPQFAVLPDNAPTEWVDVFTGNSFVTPNQLSLRDVFRTFPVALLTANARTRN